MAEHAVAFHPKSVAEIGVARTVRNTYLLLSLSLLFSGLCAYVSARAGVYAISSPWIFLASVIGLSYAIQKLRNSIWGIVLVFVLTGFFGAYLGPLLQLYAGMANGGSLVMTAVGGTGAIFLSLSGYVLVTRKDFSFLGGMVFSGLIVVFLLMLANFFLQLPALSLALSAGFMFFSSAGILYTTSNMVRDPSANYVLITVSLFIFIYNIFLSLLNILSFFNRS